MALQKLAAIVPRRRRLPANRDGVDRGRDGGGLRAQPPIVPAGLHDARAGDDPLHQLRIRHDGDDGRTGERPRPARYHGAPIIPDSDSPAASVDRPRPAGHRTDPELDGGIATQVATRRANPAFDETAVPSSGAGGSTTPPPPPKPVSPGPGPALQGPNASPVTLHVEHGFAWMANRPP